MTVSIDLLIERLTNICGALFIYKFLNTVIIDSIDTISDRRTWVHLGGCFVSSIYAGYGLDPEAMVLQELLQVTNVIGVRYLFYMLTALSLIELITGFLIIWEKRGRVGAVGHLLVAISGWLLVEWSSLAIVLTIAGWMIFTGSEEQRF
jgi:hypothetical protein